MPAQNNEMQESQFMAAIDGPTPGQSLTRDPATPPSWKTPPEITDVKEARRHIFETMIEPKRIETLLMLVNEGVPVSKLASMTVQKGFRDGLWNPDVALLLMEPTALMIIAISREVGIEPVIINPALKAASSDSQINILQEMDMNVPEEVEGIGEEIASMDGLMSPPTEVE